jgi:hypothetical protein
VHRLLIPLLFGLICSICGFAAGIWFGSQPNSAQPTGSLLSLVAKLPWASSIAKTDDNSPFELYNYPTIKWRPKPLADAPGGIAQLWTTYEWEDKEHRSGKMSYRLTVFKAPDKHLFEVQLLDNNGFKITQFNAADFHQIPGASDIMEARDSHPCTEEQYKRASDYSIK